MKKKSVKLLCSYEVGGAGSQVAFFLSAVVPSLRRSVSAAAPQASRAGDLCSRFFPDPLGFLLWCGGGCRTSKDFPGGCLFAGTPSKLPFLLFALYFCQGFWMPILHAFIRAFFYSFIPAEPEKNLVIYPKMCYNLG